MGNSQSEIPGSAAAVDNDAESTGLLAEVQDMMYVYYIFHRYALHRLKPR